MEEHSTDKMLLLLLLMLTSVSLQDALKNRSLDENDSSVIPGLENNKPKFTANISTTRRILPPNSRPKRQADSHSMNGNSNLQWKKWEGVLPNGAVSINNEYSNRIDYVCKVGCHSGFYNPDMGSVCHYPKGGKEKRRNSFEILVNQDGFEFLEWKKGSHGSVPEHSIRTCSSEEMFVGKNKYGLGKVHPKHSCFYLPWKGKEYWYKRSYEVLTISSNAKHETISDVKYITDRAKILKSPPVTLKKSVVVNTACQPVKKSATLTKKTQETKKWDFTYSFMIGAKTNIKVGVPLLVEGSVEISSQSTFQYSQGGSSTEESAHVVSLELTVPPNHSCKVKMVGSKYNIDIPFTARLTREYGHWDTRWTTITGTYHGVQTEEIHAEVERCEPLPNAKPCPKNK